MFISRERRHVRRGTEINFARKEDHDITVS